MEDAQPTATLGVILGGGRLSVVLCSRHVQDCGLNCGLPIPPKRVAAR